LAYILEDVSFWDNEFFPLIEVEPTLTGLNLWEHQEKNTLID